MNKKMTAVEVAKELNLSVETVYKYAKQLGIELTHKEKNGKKICSMCKLNQPIDDFPFRTDDRKDKRDSRCFLCRKKSVRQYNQNIYWPNREAILLQKKLYHATHPGYNAISSQRRRERLKNVRQIPYTREQIWERDNYICQICHKPVDLSAKYPDPMSATIDHIHPLEKKGPGVLKNLQTAHAICNNNKKNKFVCPFRDGWSVSQIDNKIARELVVKNHYLHKSPPGISFAYGLFDINQNLLGVVTFGTISSGRILKSAVDLENKGLILELSRLWIDDNVPYGAGSWFISRALKQLPPRIVISYADTDIDDPRGGNHPKHDGNIYKALGFYFAGQSKPGKEYRIPGNSRSCNKNTPGAVLTPYSAKNRYWTTTGNRTERRNLLPLCKWSEYLLKEE